MIVPAALEELQEAAAFYGTHANAELGHAFVAEFERAVNLILSSPQLGAVFRGNRRRYFLRKFPYSVIYQVTQDAGCHGQIVQAATIEERKLAMSAGAFSLGGAVLWGYNKLGIALLLPQDGISGAWPLLGVVALALAGGVFAISVLENYRRRQLPRVFVKTLV